MDGASKVFHQFRQTHIRFRNMDDFESYKNAIDNDYDSEDVTFKGYIYKVNTPHLNLVNRSQYGNSCDFKHEIIEYRGINCYNPTKVYCFVTSINYITGEFYKQQYIDFILNEKKRRLKPEINHFVEQIMII